MEVDAFLADSVETVNGKIYALGMGWNVITTPAVPTTHPRIGLGMLIRVPYTATNQPHQMELRLEDADGQVLALTEKPGEPGESVHKLGATFNVGRPPQLTPGEEQIVPLSINIDRLTFEKAERYRFVIAIDGSDVKELSLRVAAQPTIA
jgi:hypothetical protein